MGLDLKVGRMRGGVGSVREKGDGSCTGRGEKEDSSVFLFFAYRDRSDDSEWDEPGEKGQFSSVSQLSFEE